ncbi:MAG: DUF4097 domain-containing protein [Clostridiales bacterium]|jgi:DUF4097 and DUF4098 domain-containing protein YvlB|nr:DUF4097 domain-containing protein [Clostridiales bacterium]
MIKKALTIAAAIAAAAGAALLLAAWWLGAQGSISLGREGLRVTTERAEFKLSQRGIEGVSSLSVDAAGADIEFIPSDDFGFDILTYDVEPTWRLDGGELAISERKDWDGDIFQFSLPPSSDERPSARIKVYYPEDSPLARLRAESVSGGIEFPGLGEKLRDAAFSTTSGSISVASLEADALTVKTVSGSIQMRGVSSWRASLATTSGDAAIDGFAGALDAETVSGRLKIAASDASGASDSLGASGASGAPDSLGASDASGASSAPAAPAMSLDVNTTSGSVDITAGALSGSIGSTSGDVLVRAATAELDIGTTSGGVSITAGAISGSIRALSGKIDIATTLGEGDLAYEIETTSGEISVGGRRIGSPAQSAPARAGAGAPILSIETSSGDVDIAFGAPLSAGIPIDVASSEVPASAR